MLFADFMFDLLSNGSILFDPDIKPKDIGVEDGDEFVIKITKERIIFVKKER